MQLSALMNQQVPGIIAILRGVQPQEVEAIGTALVEAGVRIIEVPLNSPRPLDSISRLAAAFGTRALIGAGTVLAPASVGEVFAAGGQLIVSPNTDPAVIGAALAVGLDVLPGFNTPTEAFVALSAGADHIKFFPAAALGMDYLRALREVLPQHARVWAVGGTGLANLATLRASGAVGVGVGGSLYRPGDTAGQVADRARALVAAWNIR